MKPKTYIKRPGTSGIRGHLYETKLISLIYFRAKHDDSIQKIFLATNVDKIGSFDDICFRAIVKGFNRPIAVFLQAKHREHNKVITLNDTNDLAKYFDSYLKIRRAFESSNNRSLFGGSFNDTECLFVIYTTAKDDFNDSFVKSSYANDLNNLIGTNGSFKQPTDKNENVEDLCTIVFKEKLTELAEQVAKLLYEETDLDMLMNNELVLKYHVALAQKVIDVSEIQPGRFRIASFRQEFLNTYDKFLLVFKEALYTKILRKRKIEKTEINELLSNLVDEPSVLNLSRLIGSVVTYNYKRCQCEFSMKIPKNVVLQLENIYIDKKVADEAVEVAARSILKSRKFKVAAAFGNKDLAIRGKDEKIEKRLNHLTSLLVDLIEKAKPNNIVSIDDSMDVGVLRLNGGLASAIGNILVSDENSKLIKFTDSCESLGILAKRLYGKLRCQVHNLHKYKFDVKVNNFPKLSFTPSDDEENLARDFLSKLLFYTNQADENGVEEMLKSEIEDHECKQSNTFRVRSDAIFLKYHDEIQKWWMLPKSATYLTKENKIYENALINIVNEPLTTVINMMQMIKKENNGHSFNENAINSLNLHDRPLETIIDTENCALSLAKVMQYFENKNYVVLDLKYILNLPTNDYNTLCTELMNTNKKITLIIVCSEIQSNTRYSNRLQKIANTINDKNIIIILDKMSVEEVQKYFPRVDYVVKDERNNLIDMSEETQQRILENTSVLFQDAYVFLDLMVDNVSKVFIEKDVLNKIMRKEENRIGKKFTDSNYYKVRDMYIPRYLTLNELTTKINVNVAVGKDLAGRRFCLNRTPTQKPAYTTESLHDIKDDVVLILANPGMGKSTLLSYLAIRSKYVDQKVWIVRINLLEYSREFSKWQERKTDIDTLESLNFLCHVALSEKHKENDLTIVLEELKNGTVSLKDCTGDEWTVFELKLFLHFYNRGELILLFDGFDEICPHYTHEVLTLLNTARNFPQKQKMWITSRSYDKINTILELHFGRLYYEIEPLSNIDQNVLLLLFWDSKKILKDLNEDQLENIYDFVTYMSQSDEIKLYIKKNESPFHSQKGTLLLKVYFAFLYFLRFNLKSAPARVMKALTKFYDDGAQDIIWSGFVATPLHLFLIAEYFYDEIKDVNKKPNKWNLDTNVLKIYEHSLETKLKKIRFQEKNKIDLYNPDNIITYTRERADFIAKHKKLAAYAIFHRDSNKLYDENELNELKDMIDTLKEGEEKTGFICNVVNNIPMFAHSTFAEYFAVEHICDLLKSDNCKKSQKYILDFILNVMFFSCNYNVLYILDSKIKIDEMLAKVLEKHNKDIFEILLKQGQSLEDKKQGDVKSSLCEAIRNNLRNLVTLFLSTLKCNLTENNVIDFIKLLNQSNMLIIAVKMEFIEFISTIVDYVRELDQSNLVKIFENIETFDMDENISQVTTDELVHKLHRHVWARMDIFPDWDNLAELSGQIYFI